MSLVIRTSESLNSSIADGVQTVWPFSFSYLDPSHVKALVMSPAGVLTQPAITVSGSNATLVPAVASGYEVTIYRATPTLAPMVDFTDKAMLSEASLDLNAKQAVYAAADARDWAALHSDYSNGQLAQTQAALAAQQVSLTTAAGAAQVTLATAQAALATAQAQAAANSALSVNAANLATIANGLGPMRNRIVNPGMRVQQRGTLSLAAPGAMFSTADHLIANVSATTATWSTSGGAGHSTASDCSLVVSLTTTGATSLYFANRCEAYTVADMAGKTVTFSASIANSLGVSSTWTAKLFKLVTKDTGALNGGTLLGAGTPVVVASGGVSKVSVTVPLGTSDTANGFELRLESAAFAAVTGVAIGTTEWQLTIGSVIEPFQNSDFGYEYLRCCRYHYTSTYGSPSGGASGTLAGIAVGTNVLCCNNRWPVPMRAVPTVTLWGGGSASRLRNTATSTTQIMTISSTICTGSGLTAFGFSGPALTGGSCYDYDVTATCEF